MLHKHFTCKSFYISILTSLTSFNSFTINYSPRFWTILHVYISFSLTFNDWCGGLQVVSVLYRNCSCLREQWRLVTTEEREQRRPPVATNSFTSPTNLPSQHLGNNRDFEASLTAQLRSRFDLLLILSIDMKLCFRNSNHRRSQIQSFVYLLM